MSNPLVSEAQAKINLFLRVLSKEQTGYHGIETLFCRIALADTVTVERVEEPGAIRLNVEGPDLGPIEKNLAYRAAKMVLDATGKRFGVQITLAKRIPIAAGLGGGSADGAAVLDLVNQLAGNAVPRAELLHYAASLGADVPFLLTQAPLALAWGHGERMLRVPSLPKASILLLSPPVKISTADAYNWVDLARASASGRGSLALDLESISRWSDVARMAGNDFESAVFAREPKVRDAFEALARTNPQLCRMSGSGSTLFAVYRTPRDRDDARMMLGKKHGTLIATESV